MAIHVEKFLSGLKWRTLKDIDALPLPWLTKGRLVAGGAVERSLYKHATVALCPSARTPAETYMFHIFHDSTCQTTHRAGT